MDAGPTPRLTSPDALLALPYRDRQLVAVVKPAAGAPPAPVAVKVGDFLGAAAWQRGLDVRNWAKKSYWTDPKSWGLAGYLWDKSRAKSSDADGTMRDVQQVPADAAERLLQFPAGHPLYNVVYGGHPLKPAVYFPLAAFHRALFEEKFNELLALLAALGASHVTIQYVHGYREAFEGDAGVNIPVQIPVKLDVSGGRETTQQSGAQLSATFTPAGPPHVPARMTWLSTEPTWQSVVDARLDAGLQEIDLELNYNDDFGINAHIAAGLESFGFKLGGDFQKHERTLWKFHGTFASPR
ncbi:MAG: hypothetical protein ABR591_06200 [Candidatus Velthaea sp.]